MVLYARSRPCSSVYLRLEAEVDKQESPPPARRGKSRSHIAQSHKYLQLSGRRQICSCRATFDGPRRVLPGALSLQLRQMDPPEVPFHASRMLGHSNGKSLQQLPPQHDAISPSFVLSGGSCRMAATTSTSLWIRRTWSSSAVATGLLLAAWMNAAQQVQQ